LFGAAAQLAVMFIQELQAVRVNVVWRTTKREYGKCAAEIHP
jgi:hypothetical protein